MNELNRFWDILDLYRGFDAYMHPTPLFTNSRATLHNKTTKWCDMARQKAESVEWQSMRVQNTNGETREEWLHKDRGKAMNEQPF